MSDRYNPDVWWNNVNGVMFVLPCPNGPLGTLAVFAGWLQRGWFFTDEEAKDISSLKNGTLQEGRDFVADLKKLGLVISHLSHLPVPCANGRQETVPGLTKDGEKVWIYSYRDYSMIGLPLPSGQEIVDTIITNV